MRPFIVIPASNGGFSLERPNGERMHEVWSKSESTMRNAAGVLNRLLRREDVISDEEAGAWQGEVE